MLAGLTQRSGRSEQHPELGCAGSQLCKHRFKTHSFPVCLQSGEGFFFFFLIKPEMYGTAWKKRDLVEHSSQQHVCPVPCRAAGRSSSAGREVSGQYPAVLLPRKISIFKKRVFFHGCAFFYVGSLLEGGGVGVLRGRFLSNPGTSRVLVKM